MEDFLNVFILKGVYMEIMIINSVNFLILEINIFFIIEKFVLNKEMNIIYFIVGVGVIIVMLFFIILK